MVSARSSRPRAGDGEIWLPHDTCVSVVLIMCVARDTLPGPFCRSRKTATRPRSLVKVPVPGRPGGHARRPSRVRAFSLLILPPAPPYVKREGGHYDAFIRATDRCR